MISRHIAGPNKGDGARSVKGELRDAVVEIALRIYILLAKTDHEKTALQRQIDAADRKIDQLVYELYGLTEEEIRIVEAKDGL